MSAFVHHHTAQLFHAALSKGSNSAPSSFVPSSQTQRLRVLVGNIHLSSSPSIVREVLLTLRRDEKDLSGQAPLDHEEKILRRAAVGAVIGWLYGRVLDMYLRQAIEADSEANWWWDLERSTRRLSWYLLQTLPHRIKRTFDTIVDTLRARHLAVTPFSFTPNSLRQLFPTTLRPSSLRVSFFPHLSAQPRVIIHSPFALLRQECRYHRLSLQNIRDDRAQRLGSLLSHRDELQSALSSDTEDLASSFSDIQEIIDNSDSVRIEGDEQALLDTLSDVITNRLLQISMSHNKLMSPFLRPSRLTRAWPNFFLVPPVSIIVFRMVYGARGTLWNSFTQAAETVSGFWRGYLMQPIKDIVDTIRSGGEDGPRIVTPEGVRSDLQSLERMVIALSREKYSLSPSELDSLSMQIRRGDLTPVLKVYEDDIKSPLKSAILGTLIRSFLIQVQKMKVDVDVALSGIDKLLKSQGLTFGFIGVAPSLVIVYGAVGWLRNAWFHGRGKGKYGGQRSRRAVWLSIRRIERLLTYSTTSSQTEATNLVYLSSLDQGLIVLSVAQLRTFAETYLPNHSHFHDEFLIDIADLEDPKLGRQEKRHVIDRMWRSWGNILQWSSIGEA